MARLAAAVSSISERRAGRISLAGRIIRVLLMVQRPLQVFQIPSAIADGCPAVQTRSRLTLTRARLDRRDCKSDGQRTLAASAFLRDQSKNVQNWALPGSAA